MLNLVVALALDLDVAQLAARRAPDLDAVYLVAQRVLVSALRRGGARVPNFGEGSICAFASRSSPHLLLDLVVVQLVLDLDVVPLAARRASDLDAVHLVAPRVVVAALQRGGAGVPKIWRGLHL